MNVQYTFRQHPGIDSPGALGPPSCHPDLINPGNQVPACAAAGASSQERSSWGAAGLSTQCCLFLLCLNIDAHLGGHVPHLARMRMVELNAFNSTNITESLLSAKP